MCFVASRVVLPGTRRIEPGRIRLWAELCKDRVVVRSGILKKNAKRVSCEVDKFRVDTHASCVTHLIWDHNGVFVRYSSLPGIALNGPYVSGQRTSTSADDDRLLQVFCLPGIAFYILL